MKVMGVVALDGCIWVVGENGLHKYNPKINCWTVMSSPIERYEAGSTTSFSGGTDKDLKMLMERVDPDFMEELRKL